MGLALDLLRMPGHFRVPFVVVGPVAANSLRFSVAASFDAAALLAAAYGIATSSHGVRSSAQIQGGLRYVLRPAEIAPIAFISAKADDPLSLGRETQIGGDDGKGAFLSHLRK